MNTDGFAELVCFLSILVRYFSARRSRPPAVVLRSTARRSQRTTRAPATVDRIIRITTVVVVPRMFVRSSVKLSTKIQFILDPSDKNTSAALLSRAKEVTRFRSRCLCYVRFFFFDFQPVMFIIYPRARIYENACSGSSLRFTVTAKRSN